MEEYRQDGRSDIMTGDCHWQSRAETTQESWGRALEMPRKCGECGREQDGTPTGSPTRSARISHEPSSCLEKARAATKLHFPTPLPFLSNPLGLAAFRPRPLASGSVSFCTFLSPRCPSLARRLLSWLLMAVPTLVGRTRSRLCESR